MLFKKIYRKVAQLRMARKKDILLNNLIDSIASVSRAEVEIFSYVEELNVVQDKIRDIEHYLEDKAITKTGAVNLINLLQEFRIERRQIKQMWELWNVYGIGREKLKQKDYRERLIETLKKKDSDLQTKYKYRQLTEEYLDSLNEEKLSTRGRKPKKVEEEIIEIKEVEENITEQPVEEEE